MVEASGALQSMLLDAARVAQVAALLELVRKSSASAVSGRAIAGLDGADQVGALLAGASQAAAVDSAAAMRGLWHACDAATAGITLVERGGISWPLPLDSMVTRLLEGASLSFPRVVMPPILLDDVAQGPLGLLAQTRSVNDLVLDRCERVFDRVTRPCAELVLRLLELRAAAGWYLALRALVRIAMLADVRSRNCARPL